MCSVERNTPNLNQSTSLTSKRFVKRSLIQYHKGEYSSYNDTLWYIQTSSSINGVIRPVLNFSFFFLKIRFYKYKIALKSTKKHQKPPKDTKK